MTPRRPTLMGTRHMIVAGHYLASHAGFQILEAGGNAIDAGVAAGIALGVLQSDVVSFAGVAPMLVYLARERGLVSIDGLGVWPRGASCEMFQRDHGGAIPKGVLRTVVPAAPAAWVTALEKFGTMDFGEVARAAIRFAGEGFPAHPALCNWVRDKRKDYERWPSNAEIYLPNGEPPRAGELFVQRDLARTLQFMADEEAAQRKRGRQAGLRAARDAFYRGDIADRMVRFHRENGGLLTRDDLAAYDVRLEPTYSTRFGDLEVCTCGPWCQGPVLLQALNMLKHFNLAQMGHNTPAYVHTVIEAVKLAFADREFHYGDPGFVKVPMEGLLSPEYSRYRASLIDSGRAWPELPPAGDPSALGRELKPILPPPATETQPLPGDTSYVCTIDSRGNAFSATPSDPSNDSPVVTGTGLALSSRGAQSWTRPEHPAAVAAGKRPRLTPNPALVMRSGRVHMPFGTPSGDVQTQAMLQVFLNLAVFKMDPQEAVEVPRVCTYSFPDSFDPHRYYPGQVNLEKPLSEDVAHALKGLGHKVGWWPEIAWRSGGVCAIVVDPESGVLRGAADPRRTSYALGW